MPKTIDFGNNETKSIGIFPAEGGRFLALTTLESKRLKTRKGAEKWLAKRGYAPSGERFKDLPRGPVAPPRAARSTRKGKGRVDHSIVDALLGFDLTDAEDARYFPGWIAKASVADLKEAEGRLELDRSRGVTLRAKDAGKVERFRAAIAERTPAKRGGKHSQRGASLVHHGGLNNPGTVGEYLVHGVLVVGGTVLAVQLDTRISARPLGVRPSAYAFGGGVAVTIIASRAKKPRLCRGAAALTIGLAAGLVAQGMAGG